MLTVLILYTDGREEIHTWDADVVVINAPQLVFEGCSAHISALEILGYRP